eukprot:CAMPEP_0183498608 /NCGR_PEP_ID=MMETSP0371-20130417/960_1 /TAXON_ID=268820 /ORGANISM="Peridinium aciculiferum, Strain PAER-2" /LENGTH=149 /DNA_ID=CAMNT_0025692177 /DNA_START=131 /DNA_END=581 /DNA_ORIENTATION=+
MNGNAVVSVALAAGRAKVDDARFGGVAASGTGAATQSVCMVLAADGLIGTVGRLTKEPAGTRCSLQLRKAVLQTRDLAGHGRRPQRLLHQGRLLTIAGARRSGVAGPCILRPDRHEEGNEGQEANHLNHREDVTPMPANSLLEVSVRAA